MTEYLDLVGQTITTPTGNSLAESIRNCIEKRLRLPDLSGTRRRFLLTGGFPELLLSDGGASDESKLLQSQWVLKSDAVERAVYKDIPQAFNVDSPQLLKRVLYTPAGQITGVLSPASLCQNLGLGQPTLDRYLTYLERAFLVFILPNYSGSEAKVQRRGRKLYFVDGAVRNATLRRGIRPLSDAAEMGPSARLASRRACRRTRPTG